MRRESVSHPLGAYGPVVTPPGRKEPILFTDFAAPGVETLEGFRAIGGYATARAALKDRKPEEIIEIVKASGLRGRGGAGFPTGLKWSFVPKASPKPKYLVVNADESEPGTFKDRELITRSPHRLLEGVLLSAYAIGAHQAFIYIRGEFAFLVPVLERAVAEARAAGLLGKDAAGSGYDLDVVVHLGAGAYICGEETALLDSLEGKRGNPRTKPPFPAVEGLYGCPTVVNNVETVQTVPFIVKDGAAWYRGWGTEKSPGTKIFSVSGMVNRPGNYEIEFGLPLSALLEEYAGGMRAGYRLKAVIPGGSSVPWLGPDQLATPLDFESVQAAGSLLGSGGAIVIDDGVCAVDAGLNLAKFYRHESCGKCTPCREGGRWMEVILQRLEDGQGSHRDIADLKSIASQILGRSLCALGDAAAMPVLSLLEKFPDEFEHHVTVGKCVVNRRRAAVERARKGEPVLV
jgi:NADH-quinone oxidoreductase subunit F